MQRAILLFENNIRTIRELDAVYVQLITTLKPAPDLSDLLRAELAFAVSALDKLVHDLVRIGMIQTFNGARRATPSFNNFKISFSTYTKFAMNQANFDAAYWFEQEIVNSHKKDSFQHPDNIAQALSLIILEDHKWQVLSKAMGGQMQVVKNQLSSIVDRRNKIVHEGDINPLTQSKFDIDHSDTVTAVSVIELLGREIYNMCK